jgi:ABC-2 type transport system permease protein
MKIWTIAWYEIRRMMTTRAVLSLNFALPLLLIFILGSALSDVFQVKDKPLKPVKVALTELDTGMMKEHFDAFLNAAKSAGIIEVTMYTQRDEAEKQVKLGNAEFGLIIPFDFSERVWKGQTAGWEMILGNDYAQNLTAQYVFGAFLDTANRIQSTLITTNPNLLSTVQERLASLKVDAADDSYVSVGRLVSSGANYSASQYYAASMLIMFLLYAGMSAAISMVNEKANHTLMRMNAMPIPEVHVMIGKILGNTVIAFMQSILIIAISKLVYGVDWGSHYVMLLLVCLLVITVSMSMAVLGTMLAGSSKSVTSVFSAIIVAMTFMSGGFTPLPQGLLSRLGEFTVNYWASQSILRMMLEGDPGIITSEVTTLGWIALIFMVITLGVYRKVGYHE